MHDTEVCRVLLQPRSIGQSAILITCGVLYKIFIKATRTNSLMDSKFSLK